ncbi:MAG: hypothetical protein M0Z84_03985 [Gammaproteobacteria bacterium]|nr:hypothetical protein [Gammaproteobacteria bacterium]
MAMNLEGRVRRLEQRHPEGGECFFLNIGLVPDAIATSSWRDDPEGGPPLVRGDTESPRAFCRRVIRAARRNGATVGYISVPPTDTAMLQAIKSDGRLLGPMVFGLIDPDGDIDGRGSAS